MSGLVVLCLGLLLAVARADYRTEGGSFYCTGTAQENLSLQEIRGAWYAVEALYHREDTKLPPGTSYVDSCPTVFIDIRDGEVLMAWYEAAGTVYYNFTVDQYRTPGKWVSKGSQTDYEQENNWSRGVTSYGTTRTLVEKMNYKQFAGIVDVSKAVGTHMVLTFCSPGSELFSVVLSRNRTLSSRELRGVALMLERRQLRSYATRQSCRGGARAIKPSSSLVVAVLTVIGVSLVKWHGST